MHPMVHAPENTCTVRVCMYVRVSDTLYNHSTMCTCGLGFDVKHATMFKVGIKIRHFKVELYYINA